ncbi:unnamed protein product [Lymnaea stagnalis]|uniref:EGF-like domain-containing protein n=1 Tax=Lymnaea stagnalis TaxID=6523 RepID=A0AAV2HKG0_LYMST
MGLAPLINCSRKNSQLMRFLCVLLWIAQTTSQTLSPDKAMNKATPEVPHLCNLDCRFDINKTHVAENCLSHGFDMIKRCCIDSTEDFSVVDVIGIDLQECNMTQEIFSTGIIGINTLQYISLEGNDLSSLNKTDFHRNTGILYLSLPKNLQCFGNQSAWGKVVYDNPTATICYNESNPCQTENVTCPDNSHCVHAGIDLIECLCDEDYHGYKCMNKGKFPVTPFAIGLSISTVFVCIFFWFTQRRYVKTSNKNK